MNIWERDFKCVDDLQLKAKELSCCNFKMIHFKRVSQL